MQKQKGKMSINECRDSLLLKGVECHSRYHERPDRCRYCECREELQQVGMSCHSQELLRRQWGEDVMELPMGSARLDIFTEAFLYQRELYLDYFGTEAIKQELKKMTCTWKPSGRNTRGKNWNPMPLVLK